MAGNSDEPEYPEQPLEQEGSGHSPEPVQPVEPPAPPPKASAKTFSCTACGAAVTIKYPGASMSVVCESCHSVIDITDKNYALLSKYFSKASLYNPVIPLGTRGELFGRTWEAIGYMVRSDVASGYFWEEYLLFNPYYGYRFLVNDSGHWSFVKMIKRKPEVKGLRHGGLRPLNARFDKRDFRLYNRGKTRVDYVVGEFYWRVVVGSEVDSCDYIDPPNMLSNEKDETESIWSWGEYVSPKDVGKAFKIEDRMPAPGLGVGTIEPSKSTQDFMNVGPFWVGFIILLTCIQICFNATSKNEVASKFFGNFVPNTKINDVTVPKFMLDKSVANVKIQLYAPVSNSWFYVSGELVNNTNGSSYPFEMTSEYYHGYDSDGAWSEGSASHELLISSVPGGEYYLNIDTESGDFKNTNEQQYSITVVRDVPTYSNYFWFLFFLSIPPVGLWINSRRDEVSRWRNSDFNPYAVSSD